MPSLSSILSAPRRLLFGPSRTEREARNLLSTTAQAGVTGAEEARRTGMGFLNRFTSTIGAPVGYFQSLLSGSPTVTTAALAPDIARIAGLTQSATQAASTLAPRGGGRSSTLFNLPLQAAAQTSGLYNALRPAAAAGLMDIGKTEAQVGTGLYGTGAGYLGAGAGAARFMSELEALRRQQAVETGKGIAQLLAAAFGGAG